MLFPRHHQNASKDTDLCWVIKFLSHNFITFSISHSYSLYKHYAFPTMCLVLTESTLKVEMKKISHKWKMVGQELNVSSITLRNIDYLSNRENDKCMMRVCEEWLRMNKNRTWTDVVGMLRSHEIGEGLLADDIHKRYCAVVVTKDSSSLVDNENDAEGSLSWVCSL